jgi:mRNA interferase RelE/StbE
LHQRYELRTTSRFDRAFRRLDRDIQIRVGKEILQLESDPLVGKTLHGELKGLRSLRVGNYRVVYEISERNVVLHWVEHRRKAYQS